VRLTLSRFIPVCEPTYGPEERRALIDAFDSGWVSSGGKYNEKLEADFAAYSHTSHGVSVCNGTVAIHLAIRALGLSAGDEVIVPNHNGIYGVYALMYEGITPVPVEAEAVTWNIDPDLIEQSITPKTKAIMVVHLYGHPCEMDVISAIAEKYGLPVIEDAAQAHGAEYKGRRAGSLGTIATFSLFANKIITSGEGGLIVTSSEDLADKCRYYRNQCFPLGGPRHFIHEDVGYNYRMTNVQAALAWAQLGKIDKLITGRRRVNTMYRHCLKGVPGIQFQEELSWAKNIFWMTAITINPAQAGFNRNDLEEHLISKQIQTRRLFVGMNRQPVLETRGHRVTSKFPVSDFLSDNGLYLPSSSHLEEEKVETISATIMELVSS
jgi:perosamine synthetase